MTNENITTKEAAKKLQKIRLAMVELKCQAAKLDCDINEKIEPALQVIMAKEEEYWLTQPTCWGMFNE